MTSFNSSYFPKTQLSTVSVAIRISAYTLPGDLRKSEHCPLVRVSSVVIRHHSKNKFREKGFIWFSPDKLY